jgi:hypothetical protein
LTLKQLSEWNILHDDLLLGKPSYDVYIDDKSFHIDSIFPVPNNIMNENKKSKKENNRTEINFIKTHQKRSYNKNKKIKYYLIS